MNKFYLILSIILAAAIAGVGQTSTSAQSSSSTASMIEPGQVFSAAASTAIDAQLQKSIDVKNAKVGDEVVLRTTKSIKQNGETVIPKGTSLIGRVTEVQRRSKDNGTSKLGMVFDRIEGKNLAAPITASITSITGVQAANSVGDVFSSSASGSSQTSASGGSSSGGLLGGVGSTLGGVTNTVGGVANTAVQTVGGVADIAGRTTGTLGETLNGLQISNSVSGSASGSTTLSTTNKNLRVEKGSTFRVLLNDKPAAGGPPAKSKRPADRKQEPVN